jgi:multidrug resistance protein
MSTGFATPAARTVANPWVIAFVVSMATFMEVLDTTVANVALAYIAGDTGVSADEASWVVTTYLVANAVILTASSFLVKRLGRKPFYLGCLALFTISSVGCALSWNLPSLLFFRITQGLAGGGMVPLSQSILADSFPPEKRGQAFSLFGMAVVVAPIVGPTLGGWLSDNYGWEWCFMINAPVGIAGLVLSPGGIVAMVMMLVVGRLTAVVPAKYLIACGTIVIALSMFNLTYIDGNTTFSYFMWSRMFTSVGLPLVFLPIITAAYDGLPPGKTDQASALMNAARNTGGSIGISLAANVQWFRSQEHQSRLVEHVVPSSIPYQETLKNLTSYFMTHGSSAAQAQQQAFAWIAQQVQTQAALMGYVDVFWVITVLAVATVPLALILRNSRPVAHAPAVH